MAPRFWEFQQLSDAYAGVSYFDQIPSKPNLYIGGVSALYKEPNPLTTSAITHVLSTIDFSLEDMKELREYKKLLVQVEDVPEEDLLKHFRKTNAFIDQALNGGGRVFVHCAMGVSRSATTVIAYLMWKERIGVVEALGRVREGRPQVRPNAGFMKQLEVYEKMLQGGKDWDEELYERWNKDGYQVKLSGKL